MCQSRISSRLCRVGVLVPLCASVSFVHMWSVVSLRMSADLLQGSLDVYALSPRGWRVGETLSSIAAARDVYPLSSQILEGCGHDFHPVICQRAHVLQMDNPNRRKVYETVKRAKTAIEK